MPAWRSSGSEPVPVAGLLPCGGPTRAGARTAAGRLRPSASGAEHEQVGARLVDAGSVSELVEVGDPVAPQRRAPLVVERVGEALGRPVAGREQLPHVLG